MHGAVERSLRFRSRDKWLPHGQYALHNVLDPSRLPRIHSPPPVLYFSKKTLHCGRFRRSHRFILKTVFR